MISEKFKELLITELNNRNHFDFKKISVAFPLYDHNEILNALGSLLDLKISQGEKTKEFEKSFADYLSMPYAAAVNSGSSANLVSFAALLDLKKIKIGDEVIVPATTFATVVSPLYQLGLVPVYVDVEDKNWNLNTDLIEQAITDKTKAIMPVHTLGFPCKMDKINEIAKKYNLIVIEDCCEAHGARYNEEIVGSLSDISTFSFFVAHNITTGEGGMILCKDEDFYKSILSIREFGRLINYKSRFSSFGNMSDYDSRYMFMKNGYNVRLNDISSSLGIEQVKKLDNINIIRRKNAKYVRDNLKDLSDKIYMPSTDDNSLSAYYGFPISIVNSNYKRNNLCQFLEDNDIETRAIMGGCLPDQPAFDNQIHRISGDLKVSRYVRDNGFFIGIHSALNRQHLDKIVEVINIFFQNN